MQLSSASPSTDLNSTAPASAGASADLAALAASTTTGPAGESCGKNFAALVSQFSSSSVATTEPGPTTEGKGQPSLTKPGASPGSKGARRAGFDFGRPSTRPSKSIDASDPLALLALAGALPVSPNQTDTSLPTLNLPDGSPSGLPSEAADDLDFLGNSGKGTDQGAQAIAGSGSLPIPGELAAADLLPAASSSGENPSEVGFGFPGANASPPDKAVPVPAARADGGSRSALLTTPGEATAGQGEKIAEAGSLFERENDGRGRGSEKKILNALDKRVAEAGANLGTDVAKPAPVMSTTSTFRLTAPDTSSVAVTGVAVAQDRLPATSESAAVTASQAHRAVEAVMTAVDRVGSGEKQAVNLQFSFQDVSLAVRVELREGAVHTTFRTDSTELRSALAHEWQAASPQVSDRPIKLADPVFSSNHGGSGSEFSSAGDHARQQQQQQQQRDSLARAGLDFLSTATARSTSRLSASASAGTGAALPTGFTRRSTTNRLETFA